MPDAATAVDLPRSAAYREQRTHTSIELKVLEKIATRAALSVPGVLRHSSGIGQFTGRRLPRVSVQMDPGGRAAVVDVQIATAWPAPTVAVAQVTRETVGEWVEHTTGVPVLAVNVDVTAVVPGSGDEESGDSSGDSSRTSGVTLDELVRAPRTPELTRVTTDRLDVTSPTVERAVTDVLSPTALEEVTVEHPTAPESVSITQVILNLPPAPRHVSAPPRTPVRRPTTPAPVQLTPVHLPPPREVAHPVTPPVEPVRHPRAPFDATRPRPLEPVLVDHADVVVPPRAQGLPLLRDVPTPAGPRLRDIPTPRGLATRAVPTPQGLEVTVFPTVRHRRTVPVTVDTSRRWRPAGAEDTSTPDRRSPR